MTSALAAATWMIWNNNAQQKLLESEEFGLYEGISHLKLQKLLYYAQGIHLATTGGCLFPEKIMAWKHGPVVQEIYQLFKNFGRESVEVELNETAISAIRQLTNRDEETLTLTYDNFAIFTAWQLRNMTHEDGTPWDVTVREKGLNEEIDPTLIQKYFIRNVVET